MFNPILLVISFSFVGALSAQNPNVLPENDYPYWPSYEYLELEDLDTTQVIEWIIENHIYSFRNKTQIYEQR